MQSFSRRTLLGGLAAAAVLVPTGLAAAPRRPRRLHLYNIRTGESFRGEYHNGSTYLADACRELNWLMRDHRAGRACDIDHGVLDMLWSLRDRLVRVHESDIIINIHSAYRTPETNRKLFRKGAVSNSWHLTGQAVDVSVQGVGIRPLANQARSVRTGGLGIYWKKRFVHLDTGPKRVWQFRT